MLPLARHQSDVDESPPPPSLNGQFVCGSSTVRRTFPLSYRRSPTSSGILRQICNTLEISSPTVAILFVLVSVYVSKWASDIFFFCSRNRTLPENSEKHNRQYGIDNFQSNVVSPVFLSLDRDLQFQDQTFGILFYLRISRKWREMEHALLLSTNSNHYTLVITVVKK